MKDEKKRTRGEAGASGDTQARTPRVLWDDSQMRTVYANVCNVASTREEVTLLFGLNQAWHQAQKDVTIRLTDRVILNPFAAKRLAALLNKVVGEYEARYGELKPSTESSQEGMQSTHEAH